MKNKYLITVLLGLLISASNIVNASLIEADFLGSNDGFHDTDTGLYWVDLNLFTDGGISSMYAQAQSMGATIATKAQVVELFTNVTDISSLMNIAGTRTPSWLWGFYNDGITNSRGGQAFISQYGRQYMYDNRSYYSDGYRSQIGAWAVFEREAPTTTPTTTPRTTPATTSVPEPSTLAIFALSMLGLASRKFKK